MTARPLTTRRRFVTALLVLLLAAPAASPQGVEQRTSDEQRRFLEVRRRQVELSAARADLQRAQELFDQQLLSRSEFERARIVVETAQLNYQEAVLSLLGQQPRLSVRSAVKRQAPDGRTFVGLTIENLSPRFDDSQFQLLNNFEGAQPIPDSLRTRDVQDVFVSLRSTGEASTGTPATPRGTTIGIPYEVHIPSLKYGEARTLDFQLLRDVNSVIVASAYKGQVQELDIQLQQAATASAVNLTSTQLSQEADLGSQVTYDLRLDRSTVDVRSFVLKVVNLPHQISYSFVDANQARLSQLNFPSGVTQQSLGLRLFLPERTDEAVRIDQPLEFWALVMDEDQARRFQAERQYSQAEIAESRAGHVRLVAIPRGVGRIEVSAPSLFSEISPGESVSTIITLRNRGTRRLDNVKLSAEYPLGWWAEITPDIVPTLEVNREVPVKFAVVPPAGAAVGDYEVRIKTESYAYNRRVPSEDKIYRVSLKSGTNVWAMVTLVGLLFGLVVGVVFFGLRLTRR